MKETAINEDKDIGIEIRNDFEILWKGTIKPHGTKGYEWIITGNDFSLIIGNWDKPRSKPSVMAQISSEGLWRLGPVVAVDFLTELISCSGGKIVSNKISRVDLCIDMTFPAKVWTMNLINYVVSRATYTAPHFHNRKLTGLSIGKKKIAARLYDKPLEIKQKSKKFWMFNIWGIRTVPDSLKIIRIEFQLRREVIKDLGLDQIESLFNHCDNLWAYCSKEWLKFQSRPGKHHTQRKTFRWWKIIQDGFLGIQAATPLIRYKSIRSKQDQLLAQTLGTLESIHALDCELGNFPADQDTTSTELLKTLRQHLGKRRKKDEELTKDIKDKRAKYHKASAKSLEVHKKRQELNLPSNLTVDGHQE